jgi:predicted nucleotide-binding protein
MTMNDYNYGEWHQRDGWYVMEELTSKPLEHLKSDATRALMQGLAGLFTIHWWSGTQLCVRATGSDGTLDFLSGRIRCCVRFRAFPATLPFLKAKILSDVGAAVREVSGRPGTDNKSVFIVHGHDLHVRLELKDLLGRLGLTSVVRDQEDDMGMTWIEKFEYYACLCSFAFVLFTPDDRTAPARRTEEGTWRARQNVVMELGWFIARLGRKRVAILHKGEIEIPSDLYGVASAEFRESVLEVSETIRQRLKGIGLVA